MTAIAIPWSFGEARDNAAKAAKLQSTAEQAYREASRELADKERTYRIALMQEITRLHTDGVAWTASEDMARGQAHVAAARFDRDCQRGVLKSAEAAMWRCNANRRDVQMFIEWSKRVAPDGQFNEDGQR
jgi:hypothetical protein